ncbi:MAG: hypothetical protein ABII22_01905 [Candidatus Micrarchaeota archaeon]
MAKSKNEAKQKCCGSNMFKNALMNPEAVVEASKGCKDDKCPLILYGLAMVLVFITTAITTGNMLTSIIVAVVMTIIGMIYALFAKVPFKILSGNKDKALGNSLMAVGLCFTQFMVGLTIFAVLLKLAMLLNNSLVVGVAMIIGILVLIYYLLVALSVSAKAFKELFDTDYIVVMLANGIVTTAMVLVIYAAYMVVLMSYVIFGLMGSIGKGLY